MDEEEEMAAESEEAADDTETEESEDEEEQEQESERQDAAGGFDGASAALGEDVIVINIASDDPTLSVNAATGGASVQMPAVVKPKLQPTKQLSKKELKRLADEEFERELAEASAAVGELTKSCLRMRMVLIVCSTYRNQGLTSGVCEPGESSARRSGVHRRRGGRRNYCS
eukprot:SAG11_NODE_10728_length_809_cov_1.367606_2_plen_171_part_00